MASVNPTVRNMDSAMNENSASVTAGSAGMGAKVTSLSPNEFPQASACGTGGHGPKSRALAEVFEGAKGDDLDTQKMGACLTRWLFQGGKD